MSTAERGELERRALRLQALVEERALQREGLLSMSPARTGRSTIYAAGCVAAQPWMPDADLAGAARRILDRVNEPHLRFHHTAGVAGRVADALRALPGWLRVYWEGRWRGHW